MDADVLRAILEAQPFAGQVLRVEAVAVSESEARARLAWREELCTAGGRMHGGVLMAFADAVGAALSVLLMPAEASTTTVESKTNFFKGVLEGTVVECVSVPLHVGKSFVVVQSDLVDVATGKRVSRTTQTQAVLSPKL